MNGYDRYDNHLFDLLMYVWRPLWRVKKQSLPSAHCIALFLLYLMLNRINRQNELIIITLQQLPQPWNAITVGQTQWGNERHQRFNMQCKRKGQYAVIHVEKVRCTPSLGWKINWQQAGLQQGRPPSQNRRDTATLHPWLEQNQISRRHRSCRNQWS